MATKKSGGSRKNTPRGSSTARKPSGSSSYTTSRQRQEALAKEARQDRAKRTWKTIGIAFLVLILLAVLGFAGFGIAYVVTDGFGGKVPTAVIMIEDDMYTASADGIAIYPGDEIRVQSLTGATEYDVRIEANAESGDFSFTVGAEPYTWHDLAGQDVTKGFTLTQTDLGFTLDYESFETIIAAVKGADVVIAEGADLSGDMFDLVITMGETEYRFGFGIGLPVSGIELDPDHIVINADKQPVEEPEEPVEKADSMEVTTSASMTATEKRGEYYELGTNGTYTFEIALTKEGEAVEGDLNVEFGGSGSLYFGNGRNNDAGYMYFADTSEKQLGEIADWFFTAEITGNTLTIRTKDKIVSEYYSRYAMDNEVTFVDWYYDRYVVETKDDTMGYKEEGDTFSNAEAEHNAKELASCYFTVTVTDGISGLSQTLKIWLA